MKGMRNCAAIRFLPIVLTPVLGGLLGGCAVAEEAGSPWTLATDDAVTWETVHVLSQASSGTIADEYGSKEVRPVLSFRCTEGGDGSVSMQIDWQRFISSFNTEAGFKVDDAARVWMKLGVDSSNRITLSRSDDDVAQLIDALSPGTNLDVEIVPYSESAVSVTFSIGSFADAVTDLRQRCS